MAGSRDLVKRQFGAHPERYVASAHHSKGESLDRMVDLAGAKPGWLALDVATGGGHTALAFAPLVREVVASDITREMLFAARRFVLAKRVSNVRFAAADALELPFAPHVFDLVTCRVAPHHFPDCARFLAEVARVLRPGGVAAVIDNVVPEDRSAADYMNALEKRRDPSHNRAYTAAEWQELFLGAGLEVMSTELFHKERDFDSWAGMQGADEETIADVRRMLEHARGAARAWLAPETRDRELRFYLTEILLVATRPPSAEGRRPS
ncbi:MAG: methyltransferase domain-containing protein [Candidatus Latescibacteria bacterium]|nr:methyltransferase domain-containing protein [Candidatus Latescibacterota bacterium]